MTVRAKFRCTEKADTASNYGPGPTPTTQSRVKLTAVAGDENKEWTQWTPGGTLEMQLTNPAAFGAFTVGADYFIDITPAP